MTQTQTQTFKFIAFVIRALPTKPLGNFTGLELLVHDWPIEIEFIVNGRTQRHPSLHREERSLGEVSVPGLGRPVRMLEVTGGGQPVAIAPADTFTFRFAEGDMRQRVEISGLLHDGELEAAFYCGHVFWTTHPDAAKGNRHHVGGT